MGNAHRHDQAGILNPARTHIQRTSRTLVHAHVQIDLVGRIGNRHGIELYVVEVAQQLDALFGTLQLGSVVRRGFHLTQFAAHDFVTGFVVAGDIDFVHIDFAAGFDIQDEIDSLGLGIGHWLNVDFAERVACRTHAVLDGFERFDHLGAFVPFALFHSQQFLQLFFRHFAGVAFYAHVAPTEAFALVNRDFDGLLGFVFVGLDVGIQNAEIEVAVVLVELADALHVLREFLLVKLVALGQPSPHAAFAQRHLFHELAVGIDFVAFKFDVGNLGGFTLIDGDVDGNAVTREFGDGRRDLDRLLAAAFVFFLQAGDRLAQRGRIEVLGLRQTEGFKVFLDYIVLQHFRAGDVQRADGRAFDNGQQDLIAHGLYADIVKKTGRIQSFDDFFAACVAELVADFDGQVVEDRTRLGALQTFDADVLNGEVGKRQRRHAQYHQSRSNLFQFHKIIQTNG